MAKKLEPITTFGLLLDAALTEAGVNQQKLAKLTGIRQNQFSRWRVGPRGPDLRERIAIARALGKPDDYFVPPDQEEIVTAVAEAIKQRQALGGTNPFVTAESEARAAQLDQIMDQEAKARFGRPFDLLTPLERDKLWKQLQSAEAARLAPG